MKNKTVLVLILALVCAVSFAGCTKKAASTQEAINTSEVMKTVQEKANYLISQAQAFYNSKEFQGAIELGQYVLSNLDQNSQAAKDLIEKAKTEITKAAQDAMNKAKEGLGFGGK